MGILRLALALAVVLGHASTVFGFFNPVMSGLVAVEAFFIISGFYMALVLDSKYVGRIGQFYWNRGLRIFPTYWVVLVLSVGAGLLIPSLDKFGAIGASGFAWDTKALLYGANVTLFGSDVLNYFTTDVDGHLRFTSHFLTEQVRLSDYHYVPQSWSLPVELSFYIAAPFFVRNTCRIVLVVVAGLTIKAVTLVMFDFADPWKYRFTLGEMAMFGLGALAYKSIPLLRRHIRMEAFGRPMLMSILALGGLYRLLPDLGFLLAILYVGYIALCVPFLFETFKNDKLDRHIGELSYPVYVGHMLVIGLVSATGLSAPLFAVVAGSVAFAVALYVAADRTERRFRREGPSLRRPSAALTEAEASM